MNIFLIVANVLLILLTLFMAWLMWKAEKRVRRAEEKAAGLDKAREEIHQSAEKIKESESYLQFPVGIKKALDVIVSTSSSSFRTEKVDFYPKGKIKKP